MDVEELRSRVRQLCWFHDYEIVPGVRTNGVSDMANRAQYFPIPEDLTGKRVLDVGCADGFFTFLAESRGASVVSIDSWPRQGFFLAHEARDSRAEFHHMSVYDLRPDQIGLFDIVFCFGVYYHLKHPILALERIASVTRECALIESEIMPPDSPASSSWRQRLAYAVGGRTLKSLAHLSLSRFYEGDELGGDPTNWWVPNAECLVQTVRSAGFPRAEFVARYHEQRGIVRAYKGPRTAGKALTEDLFVGIDGLPGGLRGSGKLSITGIAVNQLDPTGGIQRIGVYLDRLDDPAARLGEAEYGLWRADQTIHFGDKYGAIGFRFDWDTAGAASGRHVVHVMAESAHGWHYRSIPVVVE